MAGWISTGITLLMLFVATAPSADLDATALLTRLQSSRAVDSTSVADSEITQVELLFARSLDRPIEPATVRAWNALGFISEPIRLRGDACQLLFENPDSRLGRGMFLLCPTRSQASTLLIPHGFHDRFTAEIGVLLAVEGRFRAVAWNTTPRHTIHATSHTAPHNEEGVRSQIAGHDAELEMENYFTALVRAASVLGLPGPMIQLHGFAPYLRSTEAGRSARAIISSGTSDPHESTLQVAKCLEHGLGDRLLVYPTEVSELGGTLNRVAAVLRDWGRRDFLHLELSFPLRKRLLEDAEARRSLIDCVGGSSQ
jgi:hypothetical protein